MKAFCRQINPESIAVQESKMTVVMVSFNIETLNFGTNPPLQTLFIKFDVAIATFENLVKITVLKEHQNKADMKKVG